MGFAGRHSECRRICDDLSAVLLQPYGSFRKADVVADLHADLPDWRVQWHRDAFALLDNLRFAELEVGCVDVKQMQLPINSGDLSARVDDDVAVEDLSRLISGAVCGDLMNSTEANLKD